MKDACDMQKDFRETSRKRRSAQDPVIEAFALPRVSCIMDVFKKFGGPVSGANFLDVG